MNDKNLISPEEQILKTAAQQVDVNLSFKNELEKKLMNAHKPKAGFGFFSLKKIAATIGWTMGLTAMALMFIWVIRAIAPQPQPAAGTTPFPSVETATPESPILQSTFDYTVKEGDTCSLIAYKYETTIKEIAALNGLPSTCPISIDQVLKIPINGNTTSSPKGEAYDWNGTMLYLNAPFPETPAEMKIYLTKDEVRATADDVKTLAERFGMSGEIYQISGEAASTTDYLVVDGNQQLRVRSDRYFSYFPDYAGKVSTGVYNDNPNAEALINEFMQAHGFNFEYKIERAQLFGGYIALPLTPDGFALHHEHFKFSGMMFYFNKDSIEFVEASLLKYDEAATMSIISAQEAFEGLLGPGAGSGTGILMGTASGGTSEESWRRTFPLDQTITYFGYMWSTGKSITGGVPLITLDGYTVTGNIESVTENMQNIFVEATGQLHDIDGVKTFEFQSWKVYDGYDEGYVGTIQREGEQVVINTIEGKKLILPDMPSDVPLPLENAYIMGVTQGDTFEWKSFDTRMAQGGGGGGGGGGSGFYKLNLSGTPVSFPTPKPTPAPGLSAGDYIVKEGDTLSKIADTFGVSLDALMQANGISENMIYVGQALVIPGGISSVPQKIEDQRGMLSVTIHKKVDGSQVTEYNFFGADRSEQSYSSFLTGENLQGLDQYHGLPINIWGTISTENGAINVERYEIPFPDLQFQIVNGRQKLINIEGQPVTIFTIENGTSYVQLMPDGSPDNSIIGIQGDLIQQEILIIPDESFGNRPALRIYAGSSIEADLPELTLTAHEPYTYDDSENAAPENYIPPTLTIEKVELVYYMPDPRYIITPELVIDQRYLQPAWLFRGHYSDGSEFEILIQALKGEFLLPEFAPFTAPG